jgi:hypothetical protein
VYEIETNVPMPTGVDLRAKFGAKYNFGAMPVGGSFFVPESDAGEGKNVNQLRGKIYNAARKFGSETGRQYLSQVVTEKRMAEDLSTYEVTGVRTWRMADPEKKVAAPAAAEVPSAAKETV